jgi:hypothetical protein
MNRTELFWDLKLLRVDSLQWEDVCLRRRYSVTAAYICLLRVCYIAAGIISLFVSAPLPNSGPLSAAVLLNNNMIVNHRSDIV